jgi:hypothetical protein
LGNELAVDLANGKLARSCPLRATDYHRITDSVRDANGVRVTLSPEALAQWRATRDTRREDQALRDTRTGGEPAKTSEEKRSSRTAPSRYEPIDDDRSPATSDTRRRSASRERQPASSAAATALRSKTSASADPEANEKLEVLDDLVFDAIEGKREALARLRKAWPQMLAALGPEAVEESRLLYVERATAVWARHNSGVLRQPDLAAAALEVLTLILGSTPAKMRG